jgi:DNA gyrase subunit A
MAKKKKKKIQAAQEIKPANITEEMQQAYLDYAMSVIVSRALPDVKDGLKPVQRRILYAMHQMGLRSGGSYSKSAKIVGEVLGKYHPHGDSSVYDALVRMAQEFSLRYPLVKGQGNFGSIDGDPPAAMRYTEAKMAKISKEMLKDIRKETVDFADNFDRTLQEPIVLPARIPNLLLSGADGIAVGMATKIPPHNLTELADALISMLDKGRLEQTEEPEEKFDVKKLSIDEKKNAEAVIMREVNQLASYQFEFETKTTTEELIEIVKGPDFPTGGHIFNQQAIEKVYTTGKGKVPMRGVAEIEATNHGKHNIIISELPYQVNKAKLVTKIANLVKKEKVEGITDLRDESDRRGIRVVVELKRTARPKSVLNKLYKYTYLQKNYAANVIALVDGVPQTLTLRQILLLFLRHRHDVVRKRTLYEFREAKFRAHVLEGLKIALDNLDEVIETIKKSKSADKAKINLMDKFDLTDIQAQAILDMQLKRLAALERQKIEEEYEEIKAKLDNLRALLTTPKKMIKVLTDEIKEVKDEYGDERRTRVFKRKLGEFNEQDLIPKNNVIVSLTKTGYIKRVPRGTYRSQRRGGKGVMGMTTKEEDSIYKIISCTTHDNLLFFTNKGKVYQKRAWEIQEGSRKSKGQAIINLIDIAQDEKVEAVLNYSSDTDPKKHFILMATQNGKVKKTALKDFANIRSSGIIAINLKKDDELIQAKLSDGNKHVILVTFKGKSIRFSENDVRAMGRTAMGVKGIDLKKDDQVISMDTIPEEKPVPEDKRRKLFRHLLVISKNGLGKRTDAYKYPLQKRGGVGVKVANINKKTGNVACSQIVDETAEKIVVTSDKAQVIKLPVKNIPILGRNTQGVILMRFKKKSDKVAAMTVLNETDGEE